MHFIARKQLTKRIAVHHRVAVLTAMVYALIQPLSAGARGVTIVEKGTSQTVRVEGNPRRLVYARDARGNRLPDFSYVGYHAGEKPLPQVPTVMTLQPSKGEDIDDTERIQRALDAIGERPLSRAGHRGALLLKKGIYRVSGSLKILNSGVVLRGEGNGPDGSILIATGYGDDKYRRALLTVGDRTRAKPIEATRQPITDDYVPIGAREFAVESTAGFAVGDRILVYRPSTKEWIHSIGCDKLKSKWTSVRDVQWVKPDADDPTARVDGLKPGFYYQRGGLSTRTYVSIKPGESWDAFKKRIPVNSAGNKYDTTHQWQPGEYDFYFERKITAISGNRIQIDAPMVHSLDKKFGGGTIFKYASPGRVQEVGIENVRLVSEFASPTPGHPYGDPKQSTQSEKHGWHAIKLNRNSENTWVREVTGWYFGWSVVSASGLQATVTDCVSLGHASQVKGGRRYPFMIDGQRNLVQRCVTKAGRHEFVNQARTLGPNVFVDCLGLDSKSSAGPHHRYAIGNLYDNVRSENSMESRFRGSSGTGHGWAGTQTCFFNCIAPGFRVEAPSGGISWVIGSGRASDKDVRVTPVSLYYAQLMERLGKKALLEKASRDQLKTLGEYRWVPSWVSDWNPDRE